ncbi:transporter [Malaciobacter molluscorum LMG 25693]|uniref:Molybdenum-pterin binding domain-containing protein n=1 Tax=Malaciobacter molluscorum LMG 25693 TaxID=870501 RepID=A0A2G1DGT0_9BACT|nr:transporter [Malaciobacter molluscorum]AXX92313.1 molybdenum-pterin binding domain-containing protein [Malaciobacter molluscorum LMG 25693]PHO17702.1 transporter [Malaciobacter molluscorum LMG 25693]RXJ93557.1 transporter [Malaciobacter molluscorum]
MNNLEATVSKIDTIDNLNIVEFKFYDVTLSMMSLDLYNIKVNTDVILTIKASNIAIAKEFQGQISLANSIACKIIQLEIGKLLTSIKLKHKNSTFTSIITSKSAKRMNLALNDNVNAVFKSSELSIKEVIV